MRHGCQRSISVEPKGSVGAAGGRDQHLSLLEDGPTGVGRLLCARHDSQGERKTEARPGFLGEHDGPTASHQGVRPRAGVQGYLAPEKQIKSFVAMRSDL